MNLPPAAFRRVDESPDAHFYAVPRFVTHIDDNAILAVTTLYREFLPVGGRVLDLMSSWISHLPPEIGYAEVVGIGLNAEELAANPRLTRWHVHDLNADPRFPLVDGSFDAACCCVSIDYLTDPVAVLRELGRVLVAGAPVVVTFSNRCFPTKAIAIWHALSEAERVTFVSELFRTTGLYDSIETFDRSPLRAGTRTSDPLYAVVARRAR